MEPRFESQQRRFDQRRAGLSRWVVAQMKLVEHSLTHVVRVFACMFLDCAQRSSHLTGSSEVHDSETDKP